MNYGKCQHHQIVRRLSIIGASVNTCQTYKKCSNPCSNLAIERTIAPVQPATQQQKQYLDLANHYTERAIDCYRHGQWSDAATNFGSALESLLRIRFGRGGKLVDLIHKFDQDPLFDGIYIHEGASKACSTYSADKIRKLRNAVHPDCWKQATKSDVDQAGSFVLMLYHVLVVCDTRVADFEQDPESMLATMEAAAVHTEPIGPDLPLVTD